MKLVGCASLLLAVAAAPTLAQPDAPSPNLPPGPALPGCVGWETVLEAAAEAARRQQVAFDWMLQTADAASLLTLSVPRLQAQLVAHFTSGCLDGVAVFELRSRAEPV